MNSPFAMLGLTAEATKVEVQHRYRELAFELHPDHGGDDPQRFGEITKAYRRCLSILSDIGCQACNGTGMTERRKGWMRMTSTCANCGGTGRA